MYRDDTTRLHYMLDTARQALQFTQDQDLRQSGSNQAAEDL